MAAQIECACPERQPAVEPAAAAFCAAYSNFSNFHYFAALVAGYSPKQSLESDEAYIHRAALVAYDQCRVVSECLFCLTIAERMHSLDGDSMIVPAVKRLRDDDLDGCTWHVDCSFSDPVGTTIFHDIGIFDVPLAGQTSISHHCRMCISLQRTEARLHATKTKSQDDVERNSFDWREMTDGDRVELLLGMLERKKAISVRWEEGKIRMVRYCWATDEAKRGAYFAGEGIGKIPLENPGVLERSLYRDLFPSEMITQAWEGEAKLQDLSRCAARVLKRVRRSKKNT